MSVVGFTLRGRACQSVVPVRERRRFPRRFPRPSLTHSGLRGMPGRLRYVVGMGEHDELENRYMPKFEALASERGLVVEYRRDRAGVDTGVHMFEEGYKTTPKGAERPYWRPMASRVWFQLKGVHEATLSAEQFAQSDKVAVSVGIEHLKYWFAAPEPVYLVVYVESVDVFIGMDVRELVQERWQEGFYAEMKKVDSETVTVHVPTNRVMDAGGFANLVKHRSMRIDGPAFRGRPLGHRYDPLRSVLRSPPANVWLQLVQALLEAHDFYEESRQQVGELTFMHGTLAQTLLWQSPAFAEYGYSPDQRARDEPTPEQLVGDVCLILDAADARDGFTDEEQGAVQRYADAAGENGLALAVVFRGRDLSGTGGLWRATLRGTAAASGDYWRQIGLEAVSNLVLVSTLVYLDFAPDLTWDHVNYL